MPKLIQHTDSWNFDMEDFIDIKKNCPDVPDLLPVFPGIRPEILGGHRGKVADRGAIRVVSDRGSGMQICYPFMTADTHGVCPRISLCFGLIPI